MSEYGKMNPAHLEALYRAAEIIIDHKKSFIRTLDEIHGLPEYVVPKRSWWRFW